MTALFAALGLVLSTMLTITFVFGGIFLLLAIVSMWIDERQTKEKNRNGKTNNK